MIKIENKKSLLKQFFEDLFNENDNFEKFVTDIETSLNNENIDMTDSLNACFKKEPYDPECWIEFTTKWLKEINYTPCNEDVIEIIYEINGDFVLYFTPFSNLLKLMSILEMNDIKYNEEIIDNQIYWNIKNEN